MTTGRDKSPRWALPAAVVLALALTLALAGGAAGGSEPAVAIFSAGITPGSGPNGMTRGPDGAMWFTEYDGDKIGRVSSDGSTAEDPAGGATQLSPGSHPSGIVTGPDGNLWFAEFGTGEIGELDPATGELLGEYAIPNGPNSGPDGIVSGPEGKLWFAEQEEGEIGRIDPTSHQIDQYPIGAQTGKTLKPSDLVVGPEGDLWFTLTGTGEIGRLVPGDAQPNTHEGVSLYPLPAGSTSEPEGIALGPEGDLYVAEFGSARIARVQPSATSPESSAGIGEFHTLGSPLLAAPAGDGAIWFTDPGARQLIRLNLANPAESTSVGSTAGVTGDPTGLADDGAGHLWFTQFQTAAVGRVTLGNAPPGPGTKTIAGTTPAPVPVANVSTIALGGKPALSAVGSDGDGSPITGYKFNLKDALPEATIECGPSSPVVVPVFAEKVSGTAVLTVEDADGQSSSTTVGFGFPGSSAIGTGFAEAKVKKGAHKSGAEPGSAGFGFGFGEDAGGMISYQCLPAAAAGSGFNFGNAIGASIVSPECEVDGGIVHVQGCGVKEVGDICSVAAPDLSLLATRLVPKALDKGFAPCGSIGAFFAKAATHHSVPRGRAAAGFPGSEAIHAAFAPGASVKVSEQTMRTVYSQLRDQFYISKDPVRVNGLTITPHEGAEIVLAVGGLIDSSFTANYGVYLVSSNATVSLGGFPLPSSSKLNLDVSNVGKAEATVAEFNLKNPIGFGQFAKLALGSALGGVPALPVEGGFDATFVKGGGTKLQINLQLNKIISDGPFDDNSIFTGATTLETDNSGGLSLNSFDIEAPEVDVGVVDFKPIDLHYSRERELMSGTIGADFGEGSINLTLAIEHGLFKEGAAQYLADKANGIAILGPVFLIELGGRFTLFQEQSPGSTTSIDGSATLSVGPALNDEGCGVIDVVGNVGINIAPGPFSIASNARQRIFCIPLMNSYFTANSEGYVELGSVAEFNVPDIGSLSTNVDGQAYASLSKSEFHLQLDGSGKATLDGIGSVGIETVLSDRGVAACAEIGYPGGSWHPGIGESFVPLPLTIAQFLDNLSISFDGCELSKYQSIGPGGPQAGAARASAAAGAYSFTVPAGEQTAVVKLEGSGGAPDVTLTGPGGRTIATGANAVSATQLVLRQASSDTTLVEIRGAKTGRWTVAANPGSVPLAGLATAHELPRPKIRARVAGHGAHRKLLYSIAPEPGMQVSFEETGKQDGQMLGAAHGSHGSIAFTPSGATGRRSIVALITENGEPRANIVVTRYSAPPPRPGPTTAIHVGHSHGGLLVSFTPAPLATSTLLQARFADGRSVVLIAAHGKRSLLIPEVRAGVNPKTLTLRGVRAGAKGPRATVRLSPAAKRRPRPGSRRHRRR